MALQPTRRRVLEGAVGLSAAGIAGCLDAGAGADGTETDANGTTARDESAADDSTVEPTDAETDSAAGYPTDVPHWSHAIRLENGEERARAFELAVVHADSGDVVFEDEYELAPGEEHTAFNLERLLERDRFDDDEFESFRIAVESGGDAAEARLSTNACYGNAIFWIDEDGSLEGTHSIC